MTIAKALKNFFFKLNGSTPSGDTIAEVIKNGAESVERNNESALATRVSKIESSDRAEGYPVMKWETNGKSFIIDSSTPESTKKFIITVDDSGTMSITEQTP